MTFTAYLLNHNRQRGWLREAIELYPKFL